MDTLFFDTHNILLNAQPYPFNSIRPRYPAVAGDNIAALYFPWWRTSALWSGDVTQLTNGVTGLPFTGITDFKAFVDAHFYTDTFSGGIIYLGTWDASTNTPTLANGTGTAGDFYITSVGGTVDFGAGSITFAVGDIVICNGTIWEKADFSSMSATLQQVTDAGNTSTHSLQVAGLLDNAGNTVIAFGTSEMKIYRSGNTVYDLNANVAADNSGNISASFNNRTLSDSTGNVRYNWSSNQVKDGSSNLSADLDNRQLYASDGSVAVDYSAPGVLKGFTEIAAMNSSAQANVEIHTEDSGYPRVKVYNYTTDVGIDLDCSAIPSLLLYDNSGVDSLQLKCDALPGSGTCKIDFQAASGTVAFLSDIPPPLAVAAGNFTVTGAAGQTVYNIPHGMAFTPSFAGVFAKNADTAALFTGGYYLAYDATYVVVTLLVPTVGTPSFKADWVAF